MQLILLQMRPCRLDWLMKFMHRYQTRGGDGADGAGGGWGEQKWLQQMLQPVIVTSLWHVTHTHKADLGHLWGPDWQGLIDPMSPPEMAWQPWQTADITDIGHGNVSDLYICLSLNQQLLHKMIRTTRRTYGYPQNVFFDIVYNTNLIAVVEWSVRHRKLQKYSTWLKATAETNQLQRWHWLCAGHSRRSD